MNINHHFQKNNIINNLAKYETYYQVALGLLISQTNAKEIDSNIELQYALGSIYELIKDLEKEENIENILETELQKQSAMDALQKFVNTNLEDIKNSKININEIVNNINDEEFFNELTLEICKNNLHIQIQKWEDIISDKVSISILNSLQNLENQGH